jgi:hypothetical protein
MNTSRSALTTSSIAMMIQNACGDPASGRPRTRSGVERILDCQRMKLKCIVKQSVLFGVAAVDVELERLRPFGDERADYRML